MFDTIAGLPLHPLIVHVAVIFSPLAALLLILVVVSKGMRARYATLAMVAVLLGTIAVIVAKFSGEALEERVGDPGQHAEYGDLAMIWSIVFLVLTIAWWALQRRPNGPRAAATVAGWISALAAVGMIGLLVVTGHSGAEKVWGGIVASSNTADSESESSDPATSAAASATPTATATQTLTENNAGTAAADSSSSATATATPTTTASAAGGYTLAQVATHNTRSDCWAAIKGGVYNLTDWIDRHPGGADRILSICGTDGTSAFEAQHAGESKPARELATFKIGTLTQ